MASTLTTPTSRPYRKYDNPAENTIIASCISGIIYSTGRVDLTHLVRPDSVVLTRRREVKIVAVLVRGPFIKSSVSISGTVA